MVEFSNETNYSYILNNDTLSANKTTKYKIQKNIFSFTFKDFIIFINRMRGLALPEIMALN